MTLAEELWQYVTRLEAIADRWRHPEDAHTRQIARRLRVILAKHGAEVAS